jgi:hypothetical protein
MCVLPLLMQAAGFKAELMQAAGAAAAGSEPQQPPTVISVDDGAAQIR